MTSLNGLMEASLTVTCALIDLLTRGRMNPLKKAELVPTKYTATSNTMKKPKIPATIRNQRPRLRGAGGLTVVCFQLRCLLQEIAVPIQPGILLQFRTAPGHWPGDAHA